MRDVMFISLCAIMSRPSYFKNRKSRPPRFKSGSSATLTGILTTDSGSCVSSSRKSLKLEFVLISCLFTMSCK